MKTWYVYQNGAEIDQVIRSNGGTAASVKLSLIQQGYNKAIQVYDAKHRFTPYISRR